MLFVDGAIRSSTSAARGADATTARLQFVAPSTEPPHLRLSPSKYCGAIVPHVLRFDWTENKGNTSLFLAFDLTGQQVCALRVKSWNCASWSGWHGSWARDGNLLRVLYHWRGDLAQTEHKYKERTFYFREMDVRQRVRGNEQPRMFFWLRVWVNIRGYWQWDDGVVWVKNGGVVVDRPCKKALDDTHQEDNDQQWQFVGNASQDVFCLCEMPCEKAFGCAAWGALVRCRPLRACV